MRTNVAVAKVSAEQEVGLHLLEANREKMLENAILDYLGVPLRLRSQARLDLIGGMANKNKHVSREDFILLLKDGPRYLKFQQAWNTLYCCC
jgi:hypothetical protein